MPLLKTGTNSLSGNSFLIFITRFFPSLASLLVVIWYSRGLSQDVYGHYQRFWIQLNVIYPLACFGIHVVIITYSRIFILQLLRQVKTGHYIAYAFWLVLLSAAFGVMELYYLHIPFIISFLFLLSFSISIILESFILVCRHYRVLTLINVLYAAAFFFIHWAVLRHGFSMMALFTWLLLLVAARLCIYAGIALVEIRMPAHAAHEDFALPAVRALWLHLGFYDVTQMLFSWIDKFVIAIVLTAPLSAVYFIGSQNIPFLPLLLGAAGSAVLMQITSVKKEAESEQLISQMKRAGRLLSCVIFPIFFFLFFYRYELIIALFTAKYAAAVPVFAVSVLVLPVRAYSFTTVLQRLHKGSIINAGSVADLLLACALMYPLYLWLGLPGVALSFVITTYLQAAFYLFFSARLLHVSPISMLPVTDWILKLIVFAVMLIAIRYAGKLYFTDRITLILGGAMMSVMIAISLFMESVKQRKYGGS